MPLYKKYDYFSANYNPIYASSSVGLTQTLLTPEQIQLVTTYFKFNPYESKIKKNSNYYINGRLINIPFSVVKGIDPTNNKTQLFVLYNGKHQEINYLKKKGFLGKGSYGKVKLAVSINESPPKVVAAKIQIIPYKSKLISKFSLEPEEEILQTLGQYVGNSENTNWKNQTKHYTFMNFIEGPTVSDYLKDNSFKMTELDYLKIAKQMILTLMELHNQKIVHADLKSNNMIIDKTGKVHLIDWGLSGKLSGTKTYITIPPMPGKFGPLSYKPPEFYQGKSDFRSDLYSLGFTLTKMESPLLKKIGQLMKHLIPTQRLTLSQALQEIETNLMKYQQPQAPNSTLGNKAQLFTSSKFDVALAYNPTKPNPPIVIKSQEAEHILTERLELYKKNNDLTLLTPVIKTLQHFSIALEKLNEHKNLQQKLCEYYSSDNLLPLIKEPLDIIRVMSAIKKSHINNVKYAPLKPYTDIYGQLIKAGLLLASSNPRFDDLLDYEIFKEKIKYYPMTLLSSENLQILVKNALDHDNPAFIVEFKQAVPAIANRLNQIVADLTKSSTLPLQANLTLGHKAQPSSAISNSSFSSISSANSSLSSSKLKIAEDKAQYPAPSKFDIALRYNHAKPKVLTKIRFQEIENTLTQKIALYKQDHDLAALTPGIKTLQDFSTSLEQLHENQTLQQQLSEYYTSKKLLNLIKQPQELIFTINTIKQLYNKDIIPFKIFHNIMRELIKTGLLQAASNPKFNEILYSPIIKEEMIHYTETLLAQKSLEILVKNALDHKNNDFIVALKQAIPESKSYMLTQIIDHMKAVPSKLPNITLFQSQAAPITSNFRQNLTIATQFPRIDLPKDNYSSSTLAQGIASCKKIYDITMLIPAIKTLEDLIISIEKLNTNESLSLQWDLCKYYSSNKLLPLIQHPQDLLTTIKKLQSFNDNNINKFTIDYFIKKYIMPELIKAGLFLAATNPKFLSLLENDDFTRKINDNFYVLFSLTPDLENLLKISLQDPKNDFIPKLTKIISPKFTPHLNLILNRLKFTQNRGNYMN